ncbi:Cadherin-18 [Acipenser ruthenus]|uniref:Cadherin-18 n=1 Tax=Acipenser ruthenus TaxID=7906 RepID=A0A444TWW7_ACIRT|nr:Cadherin-18 [Acipenser ruthenus]
MRITTTSCLCPVLVCLCFVQRCYGTSHHSSMKVTKNQTKHIEGETEVHHRPKRGWVWNQFFVLEEHIGPEPQYVGKLHSNSDKGDGSVRYILTGEGAGTIFLIDETTGDIHATKSLDREKKAHYVLHAQAIDRWTNKPLEPESEFIIKVQDINDNAPKFTDGPFVANVPEMSDVGTSVLQVTATDADDPTYGNSARVVYSILQGQPYFSVDPKTGVIRTALANMDREAREQYSVVIQAKDMAGQIGGLSGSTTINITLTDVNDNPPKFPQKNYELYVPESAEVGKAVGKIKANDDDTGINAEIKYIITNGDGSSVFTISTDKETREGIISLKKPLNYEKKRSYIIHIVGANTHTDPQFSHLGPFKDTTTLKITIGDVDEPPLFSMTSYVMDVYENAKMGTLVGAVTAQDPDRSNSPIRYFIDRGLHGDRYFNIDANSGAIKTAKTLDREEMPWHNITVIASEVIQTISAVDKDDFANGPRFFFSLADELPNNPNFTLKDNEDNTASILARRRRFSRVTQEVYYLPIVISDGGSPSHSSTSTLTLRVCACGRDGKVRTCHAEPFLSSAGLSTGALIAILLCIIILLGIGRTGAFIAIDQLLHAAEAVGRVDVFQCIYNMRKQRKNMVQTEDLESACENEVYNENQITAIVVLFVTLRRSKKEPLIISEEDVRENVVTYDDEGGGEEDTEAFDIITLRNPAAAEELKFRRDVMPDIQRVRRHSPPLVLDGVDVPEFIKQRQIEADLDTSVPPYDSLQTYAYEGRGSPPGSISSLDSATTHSEQDYNYICDWGPEFLKLSELFGEESQQTT